MDCESKKITNKQTTLIMYLPIILKKKIYQLPFKIKLLIPQNHSNAKKKYSIRDHVIVKYEGEFYPGIIILEKKR